MECALVIPQMKDEWLKREYGSREMLGAQYIAASLEEKKIKCDLINAHSLRLSEDEVCQRLLKNTCKIIGVSCISQRSYPFVKSFIIKLRNVYKYAGIVCMGGFYASLAYSEILNDIVELDCILRGEGEISFPQMVEAVYKNAEIRNIPGIAYAENDTIQTIPPICIKNLDALKFPKRDLSFFNNMKRDNISFRIIAGRGCYGSCSFCSIIKQSSRERKKTYRSPGNVIKEIEECISEYNIHKFNFSDEIFYENSARGREWVDEFCSNIKKLDIKFEIQMRANDITENELLLLKEAGLTGISIGAESGVQRILDEMNKKTKVEQNIKAIEIIKRCGIKANISFITIVPTMSFDELKMNYEFLRKIGCFSEDNLQNRLNLYTGCEYENILEKEGLLKKRASFYERDNYFYKDKKVEIFVGIIDTIKRNYLPIREMLYRVCVNNTEDFADKIIEWYKNESFKVWEFLTYHFIAYLDATDLSNIDYEEIKKVIQKQIKVLHLSLNKINEAYSET